MLKELHLSLPHGVKATVSLAIHVDRRDLYVNALQLGSLQVQITPLELNPYANEITLAYPDELPSDPDIQTGFVNPEETIFVNIVRVDNEDPMFAKINLEERNPNRASTTFLREIKILLKTLQLLGYKIIIAQPSDERRKNLYRKAGMHDMDTHGRLISSIDDILNGKGAKN